MGLPFIMKKVDSIMQTDKWDYEGDYVSFYRTTGFAINQFQSFRNDSVTIHGGTGENKDK